MKKSLLLFLILIITLTGSVRPDVTHRLDLQGIKAFAKAKMASYEIPGLQICVRDRNGLEIVKLSLGYADLKAHRPLDQSTQMKIGSNTKSFTAMAVLILAQRGQLELDDPIGRYLDISPLAYRNVTIRQLMNMSSGLRGYINDDAEDHILDRAIAHPAQRIPPRDLVQRAFTLTNQLGRIDDGSFHYANTNYILLGMVIEKVSGVSYADFIRRELLEPFGLRETYVPRDNHYGKRAGKGYHINTSTKTKDDYSALDLSYVWAAGAIISTASDLCRWISLIGTDAVISGEEVAEVHKGLSFTNTAQYTSGLIQEPDYFWHNGTVLGYHGEMRFLKRSRTAIAVLANCTLAGDYMDPVQEIVDEIARQVAAATL